MYCGGIHLGSDRYSKYDFTVSVMGFGIIEIVFGETHPNGSNHLINVTAAFDSSGETSILKFDSTTSTADKIRVRARDYNCQVTTNSFY